MAGFAYHSRTHHHKIAARGRRAPANSDRWYQHISELLTERPLFGRSAGGATGVGRLGAAFVGHTSSSDSLWLRVSARQFFTSLYYISSSCSTIVRALVSLVPIIIANRVALYHHAELVGSFSSIIEWIRLHCLVRNGTAVLHRRWRISPLAPSASSSGPADTTQSLRLYQIYSPSLSQSDSQDLTRTLSDALPPPLSSDWASCRS